MSLNPSGIDYLAQAKERIGRTGHTLNIVTGCKHDCPYCYARRMVEHGRLKGHKSYPYKFEPTFHPERIRKYGGKPKLIFQGDMSDVGGDWEWLIPEGKVDYGHSDPWTSLKAMRTPEQMAIEMRKFANLNPDHIILLLTKRPEWYRHVTWPENVWCGFSASNNEELWRRNSEMPPIEDLNPYRRWMSLEPWLDSSPPDLSYAMSWLVIGGLSGPNAKPVSDATTKWLQDESIQAKRFTKRNAYGCPRGFASEIYPREYPEEWRIEK